ncbi:MAG: hypothetical protein LBJ12_04310 [Oscillospiraceae bacterium]|jgi:hypothetical protein|nr:hypothetical protein [Oscillospiraceae bacterium]
MEKIYAIFEAIGAWISAQFEIGPEAQGIVAKIVDFVKEILEKTGAFDDVSNL